MTTLPDRPHTALVVIDVQNGVVEAAHERDAVVANISTLVEKARGDGVPVVWVQHWGEHLPKGSDAWQYVPELSLGESEPVVHKTYGDSFEDTDLEDVLAGLRELARRDLPYDLLLFPEHLPLVPRIADSVPDLRMVIDHIAKPESSADSFSSDSTKGRFPRRSCFTRRDTTLTRILGSPTTLSAAWR